MDILLQYTVFSNSHSSKIRARNRYSMYCNIIDKITSELKLFDSNVAIVLKVLVLTNIVVIISFHKLPMIDHNLADTLKSSSLNVHV